MKLSLLPVVGLALASLASVACSSTTEEEEDVAPQVQHLTQAERDRAKAVCANIPKHAFTQAESEALMTRTAAKLSERKRANDALIRDRGVGMFAGFRTASGVAIGAGRRDDIVPLIRARVKAGYDPVAIAKEMRTTSCIDMVVDILGQVYAELGLADDWKRVRDCARAWDLDGLNLQQALIANGWPSPTLGFINDANMIKGEGPNASPEEKEDAAQHREFLRAQSRRGSYYGTPVSRSMFMKNFLPFMDSPTNPETSLFYAIGKGKVLAVGTFRGAYHVPLVVPASAASEEFAPASGSARANWLAAKTRGEPFVMESHSLREPWDATNFEIRPFNAVIDETYEAGKNVHYATGTLAFSPGSSVRVTQ